MNFLNRIPVSLSIIVIIGALLTQALTLLFSLPSAIAFILGFLFFGVLLYKYPHYVTFLSTYEEDASENKTLYVGNLPYRANESDVKHLFSQYGEVIAVRLMKDKRTGKRRGFGFVVMQGDEADAAVTQLNNHDYGQRTLKVREANNPKNSDVIIAE